MFTSARPQAREINVFVPFLFFACLSVRNITQKVMDGFRLHSQEISATGPGTTHKILGLSWHEVCIHPQTMSPRALPTRYINQISPLKSDLKTNTKATQKNKCLSNYYNLWDFGSIAWVFAFPIQFIPFFMYDIFIFYYIPKVTLNLPLVSQLIVFPSSVRPAHYLSFLAFQIKKWQSTNRS